VSLLNIINIQKKGFARAQGCELRPQLMHLLRRRSQAGQRSPTAPLA